jgi:hypothetical protein
VDAAFEGEEGYILASMSKKSKVNIVDAVRKQEIRRNQCKRGRA